MILWTIAHQAPLSMGFSRQDYCSGFPCPPPEDLPDPGIKPMSLTFPVLTGSSLPRTPLGKPTTASWCHAITWERTSGRMRVRFRQLSFKHTEQQWEVCEVWGNKCNRQKTSPPRSSNVWPQPSHSKSQNSISSSVKSIHLLHLGISFTELLWRLSEIMYMALPTPKPG